jgi:hypothetical protein
MSSKPPVDPAIEKFRAWIAANPDAYQRRVAAARPGHFDEAFNDLFELAQATPATAALAKAVQDYNRTH